MPNKREQCAQPVAEQHRLAEGRLKLVREPRRVEEERPVVGGRPDVERVVGEKRLAIGRQDQTTVVGGAGSGSNHLRRLRGDRIRAPSPGA